MLYKTDLNEYLIDIEIANGMLVIDIQIEVELYELEIVHYTMTPLARLPKRYNITDIVRECIDNYESTIPKEDLK